MNWFLLTYLLYVWSANVHFNYGTNVLMERMFETYQPYRAVFSPYTQRRIRMLHMFTFLHTRRRLETVYN